jgi:ubiquinone/menaquinone biosynthesis C-methylase UbiE
MTRRVCLFLLAAAAAFAQAPAPKSAPVEREEISIPDFPATGYILDLGGGCRGTIGRVKGEQVVAIDISMKELNEAPASGFLKILMDASDLKFPDKSFHTVTAFFALMFMKPDIHEKVFTEAYRVLAPGGEWLIWDSPIPARVAGEDDTFTIHLHTKLPKEAIDYGYSVKRLEVDRSTAYYRMLAEKAGFQFVSSEPIGQKQRAFLMRLRKPQ